MAGRRRVQVLFEYATLNGGERSFLAVAPHLLNDWDLSACLMESGPLAQRLENLSIPVTCLTLAPGASLSEKRQALAQHLCTAQPDLIHANSLSMTRISAPVAKDLGLPHLGHLRDIINPSRQILSDLAQSNRLLAVSSAVKAWCVGLGLPADLIEVLYNGVDLTEFSPGPRNGALRAELGVGDAPLVVGIGQLGLRKGLDTWLSAAERIAAVLPQTHFLLVGEQHSRKQETIDHLAALRRRSTEGLLAGKVHWLGRRDDIAAILRECDLLMHAARQEPLGRVLLEGLACGIPIVATAVGGTAEILPPEDHATALAPPDDPAKLAELATSVLRSPVARDDRYPRWAFERFSAVRSGLALADHYLAVYSGAAARDGGSVHASSPKAITPTSWPCDQK